MTDHRPIKDRQQYVDDPRIACKYGTKCYQKNPIHNEKYKHPPPKDLTDDQPRKKLKANTNLKDDNLAIKLSSDSENKSPIISLEDSQQRPEIAKSPQRSDKNLDPKTTKRTPKHFNPKAFIKEKFLVEMPQDFYQFWDLCKSLKEKCPQGAFVDVGLKLVGPFDVLAGKFYDVPEQSEEKYLLHWRYYRDPPEFQTVLKADDKTGFHIGYWRDSAKDCFAILAGNAAKVDGIFKTMGDNIFAAVYLYLEDLKKTGDPFKRMHVARFQGIIKKKAEEFQLSLSVKTERITQRNRKIVARSFNRIGIVVPYDKKTQVGYRDLGLPNKDLVRLLDNIRDALPDQKMDYIVKLQDIITNVTIATDECDFGAAIELGLDILAHGVENLNATISRCLATNYRLLGREEFAKIIEAHMEDRKKGTDLSII